MLSNDEIHEILYRIPEGGSWEVRGELGDCLYTRAGEREPWLFQGTVWNRAAVLEVQNTLHDPDA